MSDLLLIAFISLGVFLIGAVAVKAVIRRGGDVKINVLGSSVEVSRPVGGDDQSSVSEIHRVAPLDANSKKGLQSIHGDRYSIEIQKAIIREEKPGDDISYDEYEF